MPSVHNENVDLLATARQTTLRDVQHAMPGAIKVLAPAKVNLYLEVLPKEKTEDDYHKVRNVLHTLMLHDVVYLAPASEETGKLTITCNGDAEGADIANPDFPREKNLAYKALVALGKLTNNSPESIDIYIEKNIPTQAGLAGGSTDAAATLVGAARLWDIPAEDKRIEEAARSLGADVAFFLRGGCALYTGAGEIFKTSFQSRKESVVLIKPNAGLSTAAVYEAFDTISRSSDCCTASNEQVEAMLKAESARDIILHNSLSIPAEMLLPELKTIREWAEQQPGVTHVMLSGSGSATFVICSSHEEASKIAGHAKLQGWWARTTAFCNIRAAVVPTK